MNEHNLNGKKVLVVGLGVSGVAAVKLLLNKGAVVKVSDALDNAKIRISAEIFAKKGVEIELGKNSAEFAKGSELIVTSPGVNSNNEILLWAKKNEVPVISEIELASWIIKYPLICVTGTNGKSTVTTLIDAIFKSAGKKTVPCGNLGLPLSEVAMQYDDLDYAIVELSSFQLEYIKTFRPYISIWLNFSYDHLDHHESMEDYLKSKLRIFENQTERDWAIINYAEIYNVGDLKAQKVVYGENAELDWGNEIIQLKGKHNQENIAASVACAKICGIGDESILKTVRSFKGLPHRIEYVDSVHGVSFIDDSKATNVHAVIPTLNSFKKPLILIMGGRDKGDDFARIRDLVSKKTDLLILFGEAKQKIREQLEGTVPTHLASTMDDAVEFAIKNAVKGATVVLSPGCSSFDMYRDYKERGEKFHEAVKKLNEVLV